MMNIPAKTLALAAILLVAATALFSERSWAEDTCPGTTIGHRAADCLKVTTSNGARTLEIQNECTWRNGVLGRVNVEVTIANWNVVQQDDGTTTEEDFVYLHTLTSNQSYTTSINTTRDTPRYSAARCCPDLGICQKTDCDTTDGVIDDSSNTSHCTLIDNGTGRVRTGVANIEDGVVIFADGD